jgi:hypothetical protein
MVHGLLIRKVRIASVPPNRTEFEQAREVYRYFMEHPQASDDLEGIARWRLLQQHVASQVEQVSRALELLVGMDLICRQETPASGKRYSLNRAKLEESKTLFSQE